MDIPFVNALAFTSDDCTGTVYLAIGVLNGEFPGFLDPITVAPAVDGPNYLNFNKRVLYTSRAGDELEERTFFSSITNSGVCNHPAGLILDSLEAVVLDPDLLTTFEPPYSLELD